MKSTYHSLHFLTKIIVIVFVIIMIIIEVPENLCKYWFADVRNFIYLFGEGGLIESCYSLGIQS